MKLLTSFGVAVFGLALALSAAAGPLVFEGKVEPPKGATPADFTVCLEYHEGRHQTPPSSFLQEQPLGADGAFRVEADKNKDDFSLYIRDNAGRVLAGYPHLGKSRNFGTIPVKLDGEVAGLVLTPDGKPFAGATVQLDRKLDASCTHYLETATAKTDATGAFSFDKLNPGKYRLAVKSESYTHPLHEFELTGDLNYSEIRLIKAAAITGRVLQAGGSPAAGVSVRADNKPAATTDTEGRYRIAGLGPDTYTLAVWSDTLATEGNATLEVGVKSTDVTAPDIVVEPVGSLLLSLKAEPAGRPLPATLAISLSSPKRRGGQHGLTAPVEHGQARFLKLAPGSYKLSLADNALGEAVTEVTIESGKENRATLTLTEVFSLGGQVVNEAGEPLAKADILYQASRGQSYTYRNDESDAAGLFTLKGLPKGKGTLTIKSENRAPLSESITLTENVTNRRFTVSTGLSVSGRIVDAKSIPVAEAAITLEPKQKDRSAMIFSSGSLKADSDTNGSFTIRGVSEGLFEIGVESKDCFGDFKPVQISATNLNLGNLIVQRGLVIDGTVSEADGTPVAGARIQASAMTTKVRARYISKDAETETNGSFRVGGLPEGRYTVSIREAESREESLSLSDIAAGTDGLIVSLGRKSPLLVRVKGPDGKPVAGADIGIGRIESRMRRYSSSSDRQTDAEGLCKLELRQGARYEITATKPPWLEAKQALDLTGDAKAPAELVLTMEAGLVITGQVVDAEGKSKSGVFVALEQLKPVKTDALGQFTIEGASPGAANITVYSDEEREAPLASQRLLIQREKPLETIRIELGRTGIVRGVVRNKAGEPAAGAMMFLQNTGDMTGRNRAYQGKTDDNGSYKFDRVIPGSYMLMSMNPEDDSHRPQMSQIEVKADETVVADFPVSSKADVKIRGKVTLGGKPVAGAGVLLMPLGTNSSPLEMAMGMSRESVQTDEAGQFETECAGAGSHLLRVSKGSQQPMDQPDSDSLLYANQIEIAAGQTNLNIEITGGTIKGIIEDPAGKPVSGVMVVLYPAGAGMEKQALMGRQLRTDAEGRFEAANLPMETYRVTAMDEGQENIAQMDLKPADALEQRIRLKPGLKITGKVNRELEGDTERILLMVFTEEAMPVGGGEIKEGGDYEIAPRLPPGKYTLVCAHPVLSAEIVPLDLTKDVSQDFTLKPGGDIQVELSGDPKAIAGRTIRIADAQGKEVFRLKTSSLTRMMGSLLDSVTLAPTDAKGRTLIKGLPAGDYVVRVDGTTASAKVTVTPPKAVTVPIAVTP